MNEDISPDKLIKNLENIWKEIGYSPGRSQLTKYGRKILNLRIERKYEVVWTMLVKCWQNIIS